MIALAAERQTFAEHVAALRGDLPQELIAERAFTRILRTARLLPERLAQNSYGF